MVKRPNYQCLLNVQTHELVLGDNSEPSNFGTETPVTMDTETLTPTPTTAKNVTEVPTKSIAPITIQTTTLVTPKSLGSSLSTLIGTIGFTLVGLYFY